jgi:hypothetical protein
MNEEKFREHLAKSKIEKEKIDEYIGKLLEYKEYLGKQKQTIETVDVTELVDYTEILVTQDKDSVIVFLRALMNYAYFAKRNDFIEASLDIAESYNAMDNLFARIAEWHGEDTRDEILEGLTIPPLGVHPEKKPQFTKIVLKRVEEKLGEDKLIALLKPCLHQGLGGDMEKDRKDYHELGIDAFLEKKRLDRVKEFEKHRDNGTPAFAQSVDDDVVEYVRNNATSGLGKREGKIIYVTKNPYQIKRSLETDDIRMKRFYACFCPWVRGAIKDGTEQEVSKHFCQCSGGWYKDYYEKLFEQPIKIEPFETALSGYPYCKFIVHLPDNVIIKQK